MLRNPLSAFRDWPRLISKLPPYRNCDADLIRSVLEEFPEHQGFSITTNLPTDILQAFPHSIGFSGGPQVQGVVAMREDFCAGRV